MVLGSFFRRDEHIQLQLTDVDECEESLLTIDEDDLHDNKKALRNAGFRSNSLETLFEDIVDKILKHGKVIIPI